MSSSPSSATEPPSGLPDQNAAPGAATSEEDDYIKLNRKELSNEIKRLQAEDQVFNQVFNSHVGDHSKKRYDPEIKARDSKIAELQAELRRREILAMSEGEIESKFESDPDFAVDYAKAVHYKPPQQQAPAVDETPQIVAAWNAMVSWAEAKGVPPAKLQEVTDKAAAGDYSEDGVHWSVSLQRIQSELAEELISKKPESTVNPELAKKGPDLSSGSRGTGTQGYTFNTAKEFNALPVAEQKAILRTPEGMAYVQELAKKG